MWIPNMNTGMMMNDGVGTFERWGMMGMCEFQIGTMGWWWVMASERLGDEVVMGMCEFYDAVTWCYSGHRNWWRLKHAFIMLAFYARFTEIELQKELCASIEEDAPCAQTSLSFCVSFALSLSLWNILWSDHWEFQFPITNHKCSATHYEMTIGNFNS